MRYCLCYVTLILLLTIQELVAQSDVTISRKDFRTANPGFDLAWTHVKKGDSYFRKKGIWFESAFNEYLESIVYNNSNAELNYKTGVSALFSNHREEAAGFLLKSLEIKENVAPDVLLLTGRALQYASRFEEAIAKYREYAASPVRKSEGNIAMAMKGIEECSSALLIMRDTLKITVSNAGSVLNSDADDYGGFLAPDGKTFYFASRRAIAGSGNKYPDSKYDENIFSAAASNDSIGQPSVISGRLRTKFCEIPLDINATNDLLFVYSGNTGGGDIMMSMKKKGEWQRPDPVPFRINTRGAETSLAVSPTGKEFYFVTDGRRDGLGGKDIYYIKSIEGKKKWSDPVNAGPLINTPWDEESVRLSRNADTLWFSSRGHNSIGGYDVFYSVRNAAGEWDSVRNCGYPVNTQWDDMFYFPSPVKGREFYMASNRNGGHGGFDIYMVAPLPPPAGIEVPVGDEAEDDLLLSGNEGKVAFYLSGNIRDSDTGEPVMAMMDVRDADTDSLVVIGESSDSTGRFHIPIPERKSYLIDLKAKGYMQETMIMEVPESFDGEYLVMDFSLVRLDVGKRVVLRNIFFETGKSVLTSGSYAELDNLVRILQDYPNMKIEVSGHTDNTGSDALNIKLSGARAASVRAYLAEKGIERDRIQSKGFGSQFPVADNTTTEGRAKNRRVEFKILEF